MTWAVDGLHGEAAQQRTDLRGPGDVIGSGVLERVGRHPLVERRLGVLNDPDASRVAQGAQAGGPVAQRARQNHADGAVTVVPRRATKQRVRGRTVPVLTGAAALVHVVLCDEEMVIGRAYVDVSDA